MIRGVEQHKQSFLFLLFPTTYKISLFPHQRVKLNISQLSREIDKQKSGRWCCMNLSIHYYTWTDFIQVIEERKCFRNWCARWLRHLPHNAGEPPPFFPPIYTHHCNSNRKMQHKDFQLELSIHNLSTENKYCYRFNNISCCILDSLGCQL